MTLQDELTKLHEVQKVDSQIYQREQALTRLDTGEALKQQAIGVMKQHDVAKAELVKWETTQKDQDLQVKTAEGKRAKVHEKLYSGRVHNPKELGDLEKDERMYDTQIGHLEEQLLVTMEKVEKARKVEGEFAGKLAALKQSWKATVSHTQAETARLQKEIAALKLERERLAALVDKPLLRRYDGIRQRAQGLGMVVTGNDSCPGCHVRLDTHEMTRIRECEELTFCQNCGRILLWKI